MSSYLGRDYSIAFNATNTQSTTLPLGGLTGAATCRPKIYDVLIGSSGSPADNAAEYLFQRMTTAGTSTGFTPVALDPADPASLSSAGFTYTSAGPTLTANAYLLEIGMNQRQFVRWIAAPGGELVIPATASNGIALLAAAVSSTWTAQVTIHFAE